MGTYPLRYRPGACAQVPSSALEDMPSDGAFVTLQERGLDPSASWSDFPARPAGFGPDLGTAPSEIPACAPGKEFTNHWFGFSDNGRHFHVDVAFGPAASEATQQQAWSILDSLQIDPSRTPDWRSSG